MGAKASPFSATEGVPKRNKHAKAAYHYNTVDFLGHNKVP
jgi:hypothetical protein